MAACHLTNHGVVETLGTVGELIRSCAVTVLVTLTGDVTAVASPGEVALTLIRLHT